MFGTVMIEAPITGAVVSGMILLMGQDRRSPMLAAWSGLVTGAGTAALVEVSGAPNRSATQSMDVITAMTVVGGAIGGGAALIM